MELKSEIEFKRLDLDSSDKDASGYRYALNIRIGSGKETAIGAVVNMKGTTQVTMALPGGTNKCIGRCKDPDNKTIFFFVYNGDLQHGVYRYWELENRIELVHLSPFLGFTETMKIHSADYIDGKLTWVEGVNTQRRLLVDKCTGNQNAVVHVYASDTMTTSPLSNVTATRDDGQSFFFVFGAVTGVGRTDIITDVASKFALFNFFDVVNKGVYVELTARAPGKWTFVFNRTHVWAVAQNQYVSDLETYINAVKQPPHFPVSTTLKRDANRAANSIRGRVFQFSYRYIFDDDSKSTPAPISGLAIDKNRYGADPLKTSRNYIELDYTDNGTLVANREVIKRVELLLREHNIGAWRSIVVLEQYELTGIYKFYNDGNYPAIDPADIAINSMPITSLTQAYFKGREFYGNNRIGYDEVPHDVRLKLDIKDGPQKVTCSIKGVILIQNILNDSNAAAKWQVAFTKDGDISSTMYFGGVGILGTNQSSIGHVDDCTKLGQILPLGGFPVYLAGTSYYAISEYAGTLTASDPRNPTGKDVGHFTFEIKNVPTGTYILRVASGLCRHDNTGGVAFNINDANLRWQQTSSALVNMAGYHTLSTGRYEHVVTVSTPGEVYELHQKGLPFRGAIVVADKSYKSGDFNQLAAEGYLVEDTTGNNTSDKMTGGLRVEGQMVRLFFPVNLPNGGINNVKDCPTDHNGFFWGCQRVSSSPTLFLIAESVAGIFLNNGSTPFFSGLLGRDNLSLVSSSSSGAKIIWSDPMAIQYAVIATNANAPNLRTTIRGRLVDVKGEAADGVLVVLTETGRQQVTDDNGEYGIVCYQRWDDTSGGRDGTLIFDSQTTKLIIIALFTGFQPTNTITVNGVVQLFNSTTTYYVSSNAFGASAVQSTTITIVDVFTAALKRGGVYQWGKIYLDFANRRATVSTDDRLKLYIPATGEDLAKFIPGVAAGTYRTGQPIVSYEIWHKPPSWATHEAWGRTLNLAYQDWTQFAVCGAEYVSSLDTSSVADIPEANKTTYGSSTATQIFVDLTSQKFYQDEHPDYTLGYEWQQGDRMRILTDENGLHYTVIYDVEVVGQYGHKVIIDALESLPEIKQGALIEIYTPKKANADEKTILYEIGQVAPIVTINGVKYHQGQTATTPATGTLDGGDCYYRVRSMNTFNTETDSALRCDYWIEDSSISDFFDSRDSDIGIPNYQEKDKRSLLRDTNIAFTDRYQPDTLINGLGMVQALNNKDNEKTYGALIKLQVSGNILLAIHEHETVSLYINEKFFFDAIGKPVVSLSDDVIGTQRLLEGGFGTKHGESVDSLGDTSYWWDDNKSCVVRYARDGLNNISKLFLTDSFFGTKKGVVSALGVCDMQNQEYIISLSDSDGKFPDTIKFRDSDRQEDRGWTSNLSYDGEMYAATDTQVVSFVDGQLWTHETNEIRGLIYGIQRSAKVKPVVVDYPKVIKAWMTLCYKSNNLWECTEIDNDRAQLSELLDGDFKVIEEIFWAGFLRDKNTPDLRGAVPADAPPWNAITQGEVLMSETLNILMENKSTEKVVLHWLNVFSNVSNLTVT